MCVKPNSSVFANKLLKTKKAYERVGVSLGLLSVASLREGSQTPRCQTLSLACGVCALEADESLGSNSPPTPSLEAVPS